LADTITEVSFECQLLFPPLLRFIHFTPSQQQDCLALHFNPLLLSEFCHGIF
jgi:hypothetical protein